ncbi:MAG: nicotinate phosphoribosyltransferase [Candidatus Omnitrophota bacterium]|nr:nicotinate phosphoribosyltransferase [Candidatus Omnitrophota bacterium]
MMRINNYSLLTDFYELTMTAGYFEHKLNTQAVFDLFIRRSPKNRSYFVACGLEDCLEYLKELHFDLESLDYLKNLKIFKDDFLNFLGNLKFRGSIFALPEGTIFFPNEPVIKVVAPIIEAQIIESFLLNSINLQTTIATKASRVVYAAKGKGVFDFSLRRTQGVSAAIKVARASYIAGCLGTSNCLAGKIYQIPVAGTMAHSYVMSFKEELKAFQSFTKTFPNNSTLLIDTYDNLKGLRNAITVAKELEAKGHRLLAVRLDSGDLASISQKVRVQLNKAGLSYVKIFASGNLDEYKIERLLKRKARIDNFGVGTNMGTSSDAPYCDVIYKISEVSDENGNFIPTMKLSKDKLTFPGRKQIFRIMDKKGQFEKDILALENESIEGTPLLIKVVENGKFIYKSPSLNEIRKVTKENLDCLPKKFKRINNAQKYPVLISPGLKALRDDFLNSLKQRMKNAP